MNTPPGGRQTHFGYREVPEADKAGLVAGVFRSVAGRYDLMNDLMSFGLHRLWKDFAASQCRLRPGERVLDLAGGSGDMSVRFAPRVGPQGEIVLVDINEAMLAVGRARLADRGIAGNVEFVQADAEALPFPDRSFDCVCIAFGLRNVTHLDRALAAMARVLRPGGRAAVLEFSRPPSAALHRVYDAFSFAVLPRLGRAVTGDEASYRYLAESIRRHPDQEKLKAMMEAAGFERVRYHNLAGGIVALHTGYRI